MSLRAQRGNLAAFIGGNALAKWLLHSFLVRNYKVVCGALSLRVNPQKTRVKAARQIQHLYADIP